LRRVVCSDCLMGTKCTSLGPGRGRSHYLPESYYFHDPNFNSRYAAIVIAAYVGNLCDSYEAWSIEDPSGTISGNLMNYDNQSSDEYFKEIFDRFDQQGQNRIALILKRSNVPLLDQHDGYPGILSLTKHEFSALQNCLIRNALPEDLYYHVSKQIVSTEMREFLGSHVNMRVVYSPKRWAKASSVPQAKHPLPSERARREDFLRACSAFTTALVRRLAEIREPESVSDNSDELLLAEDILNKLSILRYSVTKSLGATSD